MNGMYIHTHTQRTEVRKNTHIPVSPGAMTQTLACGPSPVAEQVLRGMGSPCPGKPSEKELN